MLGVGHSALTGSPVDMSLENYAHVCAHVRAHRCAPCPIAKGRQLAVEEGYRPAGFSDKVTGPPASPEKSDLVLVPFFFPKIGETFLAHIDTYTRFAVFF